MRLLLLGLLAALFISVPASAGRPHHSAGSLFGFYRSFTQIDTPVEQQTPGWILPCPDGQPNYTCHDDMPLWVHNTTVGYFGRQCMWDADDQLNDEGPYGSLAGGASVVLNECVVSDFLQTGADDSTAGHTFGVALYADTAGLAVSACYQPQQACFAIQARPDGNKQWRYTGCFIGGYYDQGDPNLEPIADSNGGTGLLTTFTLTVSDPGRHSAKLGGRLKFGSFAVDKSIYCPDAPFTEGYFSGGFFRWSI